jgi:hypothetical protein
MFSMARWNRVSSIGPFSGDPKGEAIYDLQFSIYD